ncbi:hypothetical protein PR003_g5152 [Phytophthora rubi]|uniref:Uncharacterized protein n=1 Tax=Phytophthora rubi TaxID=129364 RepID=A0A6A4G3Q5_9STRA|nr:hypothetical protein PR003_g5152 [Phytophthora rubi]
MFVAISVFLVVLLLLGFSLLEFSFLEISVFTSGVIPTGVLPMEFSVLLVSLVAFSLDLLRMGTLVSQVAPVDVLLALFKLLFRPLRCRKRQLNGASTRVLLLGWILPLDYPSIRLL